MITDNSKLSGIFLFVPYICFLYNIVVLVLHSTIHRTTWLSGSTETIWRIKNTFNDEKKLFEAEERRTLIN